MKENVQRKNVQKKNIQKKNIQKRMALINDITGFGRCSVAVQQPIVSAMKIQACALPTAILSTHTGFANYFLHDFTPYMERYMDNWLENRITFDGICTGFLGSKEQIELVLQFFQKFKTERTILVVDPVMGDYGKLYSSYTEEMCNEMKKLLSYADVITPNLTEACRLLDMDYDKVEISMENLEKIAEQLSEKGPGKIVITGLQKENKILNFIYEKGRASKVIEIDKIGEDRSGTGDIFSAIVSAALVNGQTFYDSIEKAVNFINKAIAYTVELDMPLNYGLCFEEYLTEL